MVKQIINNGAADNDPAADTIRASFGKINSNFDELYGRDAKDWTAAEAVLADALRVNGGILYRSLTARTTGAAFDAPEAANWQALGGGPSNTTVSPDTTTSVVATDAAISFTVEGNPVGNVVWDAGLGMPKWTLSGALDPAAYAGTPQTIAQRDALVATAPLTKKGWMVFVVDTGVEQYQVWDGSAWLPVGERSKYRGAYSSTAAYEVADLVLHAGILYRSNSTRTVGVYGASPFEGTGADSFTRVAGSIRGPFNSNYSYAIGDVVLQSAGSDIGNALGIYIAVSAHTAGNAPDPANWSLLAGTSKYRGDYGAAAYAIGDIVHYSGVLYRCIVAHGSPLIAGPFTPANWTALGGGDYIDTVNASTLAIGQDYVLQIGHTVTFPVATDGKVIRMAPANGDWSTLGATLTPAAGWTIGAGQSAIPATSDTVTFIADAGALNWLVAVGGASAPSIAPFTGATALVAGAQGSVPAPAAGDQAKFLRGDATWAAISGLPVSRKLLWAQGGLTTSEVDPGGNVSFYYGSTASGGQIVAHNKTAAAITLNWQGYTAGPGSLNQKSGSGSLTASGNLSIGPSALAVNQHHFNTVNTSEGEIYRVTATSGPGTTGPSGTFVLTVEKL